MRGYLFSGTIQVLATGIQLVWTYCRNKLPRTPVHWGISTSCIDLGEKTSLWRSFTECVIRTSSSNIIPVLYFCYLHSAIGASMVLKEIYYPLEWIFRWRPMVWFCVWELKRCSKLRFVFNFDILIVFNLILVLYLILF